MKFLCSDLKCKTLLIYVVICIHISFNFDSIIALAVPLYNEG